MRLYLIRHGETQQAANGVYGDEAPLTERGLWQALQVAQYLRRFEITAVASSPAVRAVQTAAPLADSVRVSPTLIAELKEINIGRLAYGVEPHVPRYFDGRLLSDFSHVGGEGFEPFRDRVLAGIDTVMASFGSGDSVAVFTHGGVKNVAMDYFSRREYSPGMRTMFENGSISTVDVRGGQFSVGSVNDVSHLAG